jgi:hypothetical protein
MGEPELREAIEQVDEVLAHSGLEEERRERVRAALAELHAALEGSSTPEEHQRENLFELVEQFAEEHPGLSEALGRVADVLARMGI